MAGSGSGWMTKTSAGGVKSKVFVSNAAIAAYLPGPYINPATLKQQMQANPGVYANLIDTLASMSQQPAGQAKPKAPAAPAVDKAAVEAGFLAMVDQAAGEEAATIAAAKKAATAAKKAATAAAKKAAKEYQPFDPTNPGAAPEATTPGTSKAMTAKYTMYPYQKSFDVPDNDPLVLTYPDGKTVTVKTAGASVASADKKLKSWYQAWGMANKPGTAGYNAITKRYQTPAYRAINTFLRMRQAGNTPEEITQRLQTDPFVTYNGSVFNGGYGYYNGSKAEYTYEGMTKLVGQLNKSLSSTPLPETTVMYRGITRSKPGSPNPMADAIYSGKPGDLMPKDDAYQSLSLNKNHSLNYATKPHLGGPGVMMTIVVPKGTKGAYLPANGGVGGEAEYLLNSGSQYRLVSKTRDASTGLIHAVLEVVN